MCKLVAYLLVAVLVIGVSASRSDAGPVILGGDDLTDHGKVDTNGDLLQGWLYIQKAVDNILNTPGNITRPGNDGSIAALGSAQSNATSDDAGAAIGLAAAKLGKTVNFFEGAAAINQFFADLASGSAKPAMLWLAGTDSNNDLDAAEGAALTANANAIAAFVNSGGGLMAHGFDEPEDQNVAYGWLAELLPALVVVQECESDGAELTPAGQAAFPGLSNSDIDANAGPCHDNFQGDLGSLKVLAIDGNGLNFIIGGGRGTVIRASSPAPALDARAMLGLTGALLAAGSWMLRRRPRSN